MGANSTTYAYGIDGGLQEYANIKAMLAIQPVGYSDFLKGMGVPEFFINRANRLNLKRGGKDFNQTCLPQVKKINVPTLLMQNKNDPWTILDWINQYYDELSVEKEMFWTDDVKKRLAAYDYFSNQPEKMLGFFANYMK